MSFVWSCFIGVSGEDIKHPVRGYTMAREDDYKIAYVLLVSLLDEQAAWHLRCVVFYCVILRLLHGNHSSAQANGHILGGD